jgi:hypothetical protein
MLDWVRGLPESVSEEGAAAAGLADEYFSVALVVQEAVARKRARRASIMSRRAPAGYSSTSEY